MTGRERLIVVLSGGPVDRLPVMPIVHTGLAACAGVPLGRYFTDAGAMADVIVHGWERFGFDGVQLSLGVTAEPQAFGAKVDQPADGSPMLREQLLADLGRLDELRRIDPSHGGRMPLYHAALAEVRKRVGDQAFVISTLRGPLNMASQLRGVEDTLIDMLQQPSLVEQLLDFTTDVAVLLSRLSLEAGADGLIFGEATCSPNFISPDLYRRLVLPRHKRLVTELKAGGWRWVGLHICGNILPILEDLIGTGADLLDVDHQVPAAEAIRLAAGRVTLRGNLDPIGVFFNGTVDKVRRQTEALCRSAAGARWIISSGCDIPPGTKDDVIAALAEAAGRSH